MKRRTRKQWYEYHLHRSQAEACKPVVARYSTLIDAAEEHARLVRLQLASASVREPWVSKIASFFGFNTQFRLQVLSPLAAQFMEREQALSVLRQERNADLQRAIALGADEYRAAHAVRKEEAAARSERAVQRKRERRVRYLERSPAIRSAARFFRRLLIGLHATETGHVFCFYCGVSIPSEDVHLEHKRPVSRGGDNRRGNLVLACSECNLKKGRKTHDEFLRSIGRDAL